MIDPPPILELSYNDPSASKDEVSSKIRYPFSVIHCALWDAQDNMDTTAMPLARDRRQQRRLMGTLVASPFVGKDEHNVEGAFFCFPDLSCRTPGFYRLKFQLMILDPAKSQPGDSLPIVSTTMSKVFQVFPAKDFPGMKASTLLTRKLKEQGCLIAVKKGNEKSDRKESKHTRDGDSEDDDDEDDGDQVPSLKRTRL